MFAESVTICKFIILIYNYLVLAIDFSVVEYGDWNAMDLNHPILLKIN